jgi:hypothetical protein
LPRSWSATARPTVEPCPGARVKAWLWRTPAPGMGKPPGGGLGVPNGPLPPRLLKYTHPLAAVVRCCPGAGDYGPGPMAVAWMHQRWCSHGCTSSPHGWTSAAPPCRAWSSHPWSYPPPVDALSTILALHHPRFAPSTLYTIRHPRFTPSSLYTIRHPPVTMPSMYDIASPR